MRRTKSIVAGTGGIGVASVIALLGIQPVVGVAGGALTVALLLRRYEPIRPYAIAGTLYMLGLGAFVVVLPIYPTAYAQTTLVSLLFVGVLSVAVLVIRELLRRVVRAAVNRKLESEQTGERAGRTTSSVIGTLVLAWSVLSAKERIARTGAVGVIGPVAFVLDFVGFGATIPVVLEDGFSLSLFTFIGAVAVGFHTLSSWHAAWQLKDDEHLRSAGKTVKDGATSAGRTVKDGASNAGEASKAKVAGTHETLAATLSEARSQMQDRTDNQSSD